MNDKSIMKDGKPHKIAQVIMLPTEKESKLYKYGSPPVILAFSNFTQKATYGNYEIYILSDEEIKEGDWTEFEGEVKQAGKAMLEYLNSSGDEAFKKIIATTDEALTYKISVDCGSSIGNTLHTKNLPRPSDDFLKAFVKAQGKIDKVLVQYEYKGREYVDEQDGIGYDKVVLKVAPDNTITIKPIQEEKRNIDDVHKECLDYLLTQVEKPADPMNNLVSFNAAQMALNLIVSEIKLGRVKI